MYSFKSDLLKATAHTNTPYVIIY